MGAGLETMIPVGSGLSESYRKVRQAAIAFVSPAALTASCCGLLTVQQDGD